MIRSDEIAGGSASLTELEPWDHTRPPQPQQHGRPLSRTPISSGPPRQAATSVTATLSPRPTISSSARVGSTATGILPNRGYKHLRFWGIPPIQAVTLTCLLHAQTRSATNGGRGQLPWREGWRGGSRRWSHARFWGETAKAVGIDVDETPAPGAVALWEHGWPDLCRNDDYHGHVAYVKSVSDDGNTITVSEYNYGAVRCSYGERTLKRGKHNWPDKFIHFERANP